MFPAATGFGLALLVTIRSACEPEETGIVTLAELLPAFRSRVVEATVTVSLIRVPPGVPLATL